MNPRVFMACPRRSSPPGPNRRISTGSPPLRAKLAYTARGGLNLGVTVAIMIGLRAALRGRVPAPALSILVLVPYVGGARWIERRHPDEFLARAGLTEFAAGLALGLTLSDTLMLQLWILRRLSSFLVGHGRAAG